MALITYSQQQTIKAISANNQSKYAQIATEVEETELRDLLGVALLQDIQDNPKSTQNVALLSEYEFEDCNGNNVKHKGLRYVLAYLIYAKYIGQSFVNDTFTGFVQKNRPDSELVSDGTIKRLQIENRKIALTEWDLIKEYLNLNCDTYTLWISSESKKPHLPKMTFLRNTYE